jgi:hypothetical protein
MGGTSVIGFCQFRLSTPVMRTTVCGIANTYDFAIDFDCSMYTELSRLSRTAGKHGSKNGNVQSPLHGRKGHVHVRRDGLGRYALGVPHWLCVLAGASAGSLFGSVELGHVPRVHVDDGQEAPAEHAFPVTLPDVLAVVGTQQTLGPPFLLEEGLLVADADLGVPLPREVVEVIFVPGLPEFLKAHTDED